MLYAVKQTYCNRSLFNKCRCNNTAQSPFVSACVNMLYPLTSTVQSKTTKVVLVNFKYPKSNSFKTRFGVPTPTGKAVFFNASLCWSGFMCRENSLAHGNFNLDSCLIKAQARLLEPDTTNTVVLLEGLLLNAFFYVGSQFVMHRWTNCKMFSCNKESVA